MGPRFSMPPFPTGWYGLCASGELAPGGVLARTVCGRELAVYRTASGQAVAVDAACPHLGAHLGHTSHVEGETLRCSFHGFRFDTSGACVETGYGTRPPPKCTLRTWPVEEVNGFVLLHFDAAGRPPPWRVPASPEESGWTRTRTRLTRLPSHVQDLAENSVDVGHLSHVHGYRELEALDELRIEGPLLRALPSVLFDFFVARIAFRTYCEDVDADVPIWSTKLHVDPPRLAEGDGPIGRYRKWARQFYPELALPKVG